jgi:N-acetylneuraminate synthase
LSDHSGNIFAGLAAVTLGAEVLEIHVAFSREMFGPDVKSSVTTSELKQLVEGCRLIERIIDSPVGKESLPDEIAGLRTMFTKSVVAGADLSAGTTLTAEHLKLKKPGNGMSPRQLPKLLGRTLLRDVQMNDPVLLEDLV